MTKSTIIKALGGIGLAAAVSLGASACGSSTHRSTAPVKGVVPIHPVTAAVVAPPACDPQVLVSAAEKAQDAQAPSSPIVFTAAHWACDGNDAIANLTSPQLDGAFVYYHAANGTWVVNTFGGRPVINDGDYGMTPQNSGIPAGPFAQLNSSIAQQSNVSAPQAAPASSQSGGGSDDNSSDSTPSPAPTTNIPAGYCAVGTMGAVAPCNSATTPAPAAQTPSYSNSSGIQPNGGSGDTGAASDDPTDNGPSYSAAPSYSNEGAPSYSSGGIQSNGGSGDTGAAGDDPGDNG